MTQLLQLDLDRATVRFSCRSGDSNTITILTGPNGSGKTQILTAIAYHYRYGQQRSAHLTVAGEVSRIIVQTFSPFSRFPAPTRSKNTLSEIYAEGRIASDDYRAIGVHRSMRHSGGSFARHVLEQAIFRISESVGQVGVMGSVLEYLGFKPKIELSYKPKPALSAIMGAHSQQRLDELLSTAPQSGDKDIALILKQVRESDVTSVSELLATAIEYFGYRELDGKGIKFAMEFRNNKSSRSYAELQSLTVLRRFNLLRLEECALTTLDGKKVELSYASSGQQQLLCSLFGLASEVRDHCIVLIDEPELSLHPKWQLAFISKLQQVLSAVEGCHVIIATHSPLLVQAAQEQQIEIMNLCASDHDEPEAEPVQHRPSVEEALINVFETPVPHSLYLSNELIRVVSMAERGGTQGLGGYKSRLEELREVYMGSEEEALIEKARRLVDAVELSGHDA